LQLVDSLLANQTEVDLTPLIIRDCTDDKQHKPRLLCNN